MTMIQDLPFSSIDVALAAHPEKSKLVNTKEFSTSFKQTLADQLQQEADGIVKLSKHAKERMTERQITVTRDEWRQIHQKMDEAGKMGVGDSLVITRRAAFVVNAPKNTIITAMDLNDARTHIFTNIQGTIVL
ncbi:flagellar operon protein [Sporolactobacillus spathodeae]|uniref:Flagellar operon protein n=2 Tax=Sporolactobacillus spathodeae TaxID=1465502 RepID=A0ABS2Q7J3_9BACL|nr:flagellar operon protein [Sporolactobacillus spathodeae]